MKYYFRSVHQVEPEIQQLLLLVLDLNVATGIFFLWFLEKNKQH